MNGINSNKKYDRLLFIGTTNFPNSIAPSALRPGRFGLHFRIDIPDLKTRYSLIQRLISKDPLFTELLGFMDLKRAAVMTAGYTQADITALFGRLLNLVKSKIISALVKRIENNDPKPSHFQSHDFMISQAEVDQFIQTSHKTSTESSLQDLQKFEEEFNIKPLTGGIKEHYDTLLKEGNI
jgi:SpoVK/Ycf46/Vps4 family AAA+-type ATPase